VSFLEDLPRFVLYGLAFLVPLLGAMLLTPVVARLAFKYRLLDHPGDHKMHRRATPYLGGLAVGGGMMLVGLAVVGVNGELFTVVGAALVLGLVGLRDDVRTVSPWWRLGFEAAAGVALWLVGVRAGLFPDLAILGLPLTVLWVVTVVNAFNMIDNMDGVASAVATCSALGIAAIAGHNGDFLVTALALAVAGAALGFLRENFPPASIFLGDAGSMFLGFLIAALTLKLDLPVGDALPRVLSIALLAAVPLFDLTLVVLARIRGRRPLMAGGTDHTSHRLRQGGAPDRTVLLELITVQAGCSALAFAVYQASSTVVLAIGAVIVLTWLALLWAFLRMPVPARDEVATDTVVTS
jgi:UDP-GlcNAc:undecaprenyl-phosphate GlcNAc-1-phosphate transferase